MCLKVVLRCRVSRGTKNFQKIDNTQINKKLNSTGGKTSFLSYAKHEFAHQARHEIIALIFAFWKTRLTLVSVKTYGLKLETRELCQLLTFEATYIYILYSYGRRNRHLPDVNHKREQFRTRIARLLHRVSNRECAIREYPGGCKNYGFLCFECSWTFRTFGHL